MSEPKPRERPSWYRTCRGITNHDLALKETRFFWRVRNNLVCREPKCGYSFREPCNPHFAKQRAWLEDEVFSVVRCFIKRYAPPLYWVATKCKWFFQGLGILVLLFGSIAVVIAGALYLSELFI